MNKPEHNHTSRTPYWQSRLTSRPPRARTTGLIALAAVVAAGAIGSQTLMEWLQPENGALNSKIEPPLPQR